MIACVVLCLVGVFVLINVLSSNSTEKTNNGKENTTEIQNHATLKLTELTQDKSLELCSKDINVVLNGNGYIVYSSKNIDSYFAGKYKIFKADASVLEGTNLSKKDYKSFYVLKCYLDVHHVKNETERYTGKENDGYAFTFAIVKDKYDELVLINNNKNIQFDKFIF